MNRNTTLIAAIAVLLIGAGVFAYIRSDQTESDGAAADGAPSRNPAAGPASSSPDLKPTRAPERQPRKDDDSELIETYGESRTNLSRQVVGNVTSLLDDVLEMGDMMVSGEGGGAFGNRGDWAIRGLLNDTGVELDDEQRDAVSELYREYQKREIEKTRAAVESLKEEPSALMSLMLASDARSRGELGEEEYKTMQQDMAKEMEGIVNPLDRNNFRGGQPMQDEQFRSKFEAILNEDQAASFSDAMEDRDPPAGPSNITELPVMDLESLDKSISSAKQMTTGFKNIMQGMGGLQEMQQLRDNRNEGGE